MVPAVVHVALGQGRPPPVGDADDPQQQSPEQRPAQKHEAPLREVRRQPDELERQVGVQREVARLRQERFQELEQALEARFQTLQQP